MVKLKSKERLKRSFKAYERGTSQEYMSKQLGITTRWFRELYKEWKITGDIPIKRYKLGRPLKEIPMEETEIIIKKYEKYRLNAMYLEKIIYAEEQIRIPHNRIHKVLISKGLAKKEPNKQKRRKAWIRYEREYSLSAGHLDWHEPSDGRKVCVVLDDASRKILSGGEFKYPNS